MNAFPRRKWPFSLMAPVVHSSVFRGVFDKVTHYLSSFLILQWKAYLFFFRELLMLGTSRVSRLVTVNLYPTCNLQTIP